MKETHAESLAEFMKTQCFKLQCIKPVRFLCVLCVCLWGAIPRVYAQTLGIQVYPGLTITGVVSSVYSIEYATDLQTNDWHSLEFLELPASPYLWIDKSTPGIAHRFYRAALFAPTNLVFIPPGTFRMGSPENEAERYGDEGPQTAVTMTQGFYIGKYPVTQGEYLAVLGHNPSFFNGGIYGTDLTRPVEQVSWSDATNYCAKRTTQELATGRIPGGSQYRLPTEAEWEYACRAWTSTAFYLGAGLYSGQANFNGQYEYDASLGDISNPSGIYLQTTTPVGNYAPNPWGLYDMIGNVFEWCQDWWSPSYPGGSLLDPQGAISGSSRVLRGGGWANSAFHCRAARRFHDSPASNYDIGFRIVLAPSQP
jgi:formylglycine-generating enzyme required for sulfatase activity